MTCSKHGLLVRPTPFDFLHEKLITIVPLSVALIAIIRYSDGVVWPLVYIAIIATHMTHIFLRRCPYCAYYKTASRCLECLWWRWVPKIRKEKSGPAPKYFKYYTPVAVLTISFFPIYWLTSQWELLLLYVMSWGVLALSLYMSGCARCIDFGCRYNAVPEAVRDEYLSSENR